MTGLGENMLFVHGDWSTAGTPVLVCLGVSPNHRPSWLQSTSDLCHLFSQKDASHRGLWSLPSWGPLCFPWALWYKDILLASLPPRRPYRWLFVLFTGDWVPIEVLPDLPPSSFQHSRKRWNMKMRWELESQVLACNLFLDRKQSHMETIW